MTEPTSDGPEASALPAPRVAAAGTDLIPAPGRLAPRDESPEEQLKRALAVAVTNLPPDQVPDAIRKFTDAIVALNKSVTDNTLATNTATTRTMTVRMGMALSGFLVILGLASAVLAAGPIEVVLTMIAGGFASLWGVIAIGAGSVAMTKALLAFFARRSDAMQKKLTSKGD